MIISRQATEKLIASGDATEIGIVDQAAVRSDIPGTTKYVYMAINRHDIARTDHYRIPRDANE